MKKISYNRFRYNDNHSFLVLYFSIPLISKDALQHVVLPFQSYLVLYAYSDKYTIDIDIHVKNSKCEGVLDITLLCLQDSEDLSHRFENHTKEELRRHMRYFRLNCYLHSKFGTCQKNIELWVTSTHCVIVQNIWMVSTISYCVTLNTFSFVNAVLYSPISVMRQVRIDHIWQIQRRSFTSKYL